MRLLIAAVLLLLTACTSTPKQPHPYVGKQAHITTGRGGVLHLTVDRAAYSEWTGYALSNDAPSQQRMISQGKAFPVMDGTLVSVLDLNWGFDGYVRVLEGAQKDKTGWLDFDRLRFDP